MGREIEILKLHDQDNPELFSRIASIHSAEIHGGVLPLLGEKFLTQLYKDLVKSPKTHVWYAVEDQEVLGFICGCANVTKTYLSVFSRSCMTLLWLSLPSLMSKALWVKVFQLILYPFSSGKVTEGAETEMGKYGGAQLLSIAITSSAAGLGIGRRLVLSLEKSFVEWKARGVYYVTTRVDAEASNKFYQSIGFEACGVFNFHGMLVQRYEKKIPEESRKKNS